METEEHRAETEKKAWEGGYLYMYMDWFAATCTTFPDLTSRKMFGTGEKRVMK